MHLARRDVDVIEQRFPRLFFVALVIVLGNVALVAPEQMHLRPVDLLPLGAEIFQQTDTVAAAGQHDPRSPPGRHGSLDGVDQPAAGGPDQGLAVRDDVDDRAHAYCTLSMPCSAPW